MRLALSEQRMILEGAFVGSSSGMALLDLSGRFIRVNRALCELMGYPEQELTRKSFQDVTYPDDQDVSQSLFQRMITGEVRSVQVHKRYVHRSGHLLWAFVSTSVVRDAQGVPRFLVAQVNEVTEGKREVDALASWDWDLREDVVTWAEPTFRIFGLEPHAVVPSLETYLSLVHPEDRELIRSSLEHATFDHLPFSIEQRVLRQDGEARILLVRGEVEVGPQGQAIRMRGSLQDITESRQALDEVFRQAEAYREVSELLKQRNAEVERQIAERDQDLLARDLMFQRILNHVPAAVAYFDRSHACQWMSPEALERFGLDPEQVCQLSAADVPLFGRSAERFEAVMEAGEPFRERDVPLKLPHSGPEQQTYWDYALIPCRTPQGEPEGLLAFAREVTDRIAKEQLQAQQIKTLEASEALKDHFLSTLTHEIRSPLTVILGVGLLFQGEVLGPLTEKQGVYVAKLLRNARELSLLVNNVLESSLLRSGRLELYVESLAPEAVLREAKAEFQAAADVKQLELVESLDGELPRVPGDRRRLTQVWLNLVANAVHHAPEGGRIVLRAGLRGDRLRGEVFNSGSRIPESALCDLFTALEHPGMGQKGLGLGLGLSKALVEAHGGMLGVFSTEEGVTAWFEVPLSAGSGEPA